MPMKMHWHGWADVRGDSSPLNDYLVEYTDNADIAIIWAVACDYQQVAFW